jgi:heterodisulfide reductase subunit C
LTLCNTSLFFTWSMICPSDVLHPYLAWHFETFQVVSNFQLHIQLCFKCSISLVSSLLEVQFVHEKSLLLVECYFFNGNLWFDFTCTSCIICYRAIQIVGIIHILHFFRYLS